MLKPIRRLLPLLLAFLILAPLAQAGEFRLASVEIVKPRRNGGVQLSVELADTLELRLRGLSGRSEMPRDGMLFDFEEELLMEMWTKNVHLRLDMLFLSEKGNVFLVVKDLEPDSLRVVSSERKGRYVLCLPAGDADRLDIRRGAKMYFRH